MNELDAFPPQESRESQRLATDDRENVYFREIFNDFVALKRQCGESTENLTFDKFATKLRANRDALIPATPDSRTKILNGIGGGRSDGINTAIVP